MSLSVSAQSLSFGTACYFTIVTMATVGYGDIGVRTDVARFVVCLVILTSLVWLPLEINKLTQVTHSRPNCYETKRESLDHALLWT